MEKVRVLIIEDDPDGRRSVTEAVEDAGMEVVAMPTGEEGLAAFRQQAFDIVLTDLVLPDIDGIDVLERLLQLHPEIPVMIMTAYGSVSSSVRAIKSGAYDYITKPLDLDDLQAKLKRAAETARLRRRVVNFESSAREQFGSGAIIAEDPRMLELLEQVRTLAGTTATVLIQGESGTGKELIARALHYDGSRADGPFVAVNCGAFTESLLVSELFGHEKGSFTGAFRQHRGAFERAHGGTLFLDEIADAPPDVQVKLLRVLETREVQRVGGQTLIRVDVRVVSASNRPLPQRVAEGAFREDLLYRLNVVDLTVPPLRERRRDIRPLADVFVTTACAEHGRTIHEIMPSFYDALEAYHWPGNVRQLRNAIESAIVITRASVLDAGSLSATIRPAAGKPPSAPMFEAPTGMTLAEIEREILRQTLARTQANRTLTADQLGLSRRTIQRKIKEHSLDPPGGTG
jgi:DNA-binding NtrC family response regulator